MTTRRWTSRAVAGGAVLVAVVGCAASTPPSGRPAPTSNTPVPVSDTAVGMLGAWADFPAQAAHRPWVLIGSSVVGPSSGFASSADKMAFIGGSFKLATALPTQTSTTTGQRVISARDALGLLKTAGAKSAGAATGLTITRVELTSATFETDRGSKSLPAWSFTMKGVSNPVYVLALPQSQWWPKPGMTTGMVVGSNAVSADGRRATISFVGAAPGTGPCEAEYTAEVRYSPGAVLVLVRELPHPTIATNYGCFQVGYRRVVVATLNTPLGNRVLLTPQGPPLPPR